MIFNLTRALIALSAAAAVVGILYILRERFRKAMVSYLPLWEEVLKKTPATTLVRKFRRIFSYLFQLLIIILLIFSITETGYGEEKTSRAMAILIDTSISMASTDVESSRFDRALKFAEKLARAMKENDRALLLEMSDSPKVVHSWTGSPEEIIRSIKKMKLSNMGNDFVSSLKLSSAALEGLDVSEKEIWIISDGAYEPSSKKLRYLKTAINEIKRKGITIHHFKTGKESSNLAITRFSARQNLKEKLKLSTNIVINTFQKADKSGPEKKKQKKCDKINLKILSGKNTVFNQPIEKERFGEIISVDIPAPASRILEAKISPSDPACAQDFLLTDNQAGIKLPKQLQLKILAITEGNTYLKAVLLLSPLWDVEIAPYGQRPSDDTYDVVVADGSPVPDGIKRKGTLYIEPQFEDFPLTVKGATEASAFDEYEYNHPALRWTNLYNVNIAKALDYAVRKEDKVIASSSEGPLIIEMTGSDDRRDMVLAFSIQNTDMALRTTWPLLFINMLYYLSGTTMEVSSASNSPQEANIMPRWLPQVKKIKKDPEAYHAFPLWIILILAALLLNMVEWFSFHRRWTV